MTATIDGGGRPTKVGQFNGSYRENEDEQRDKKVTRAFDATAKGHCWDLWLRRADHQGKLHAPESQDAFRV